MKLVILFIVLVFSASVFAGSGGGTVTQILVHGGASGIEPGFVFFKTQNNNNKASCDAAGAWAISLEHEYGQAMHAVLMLAQANGKSVGVTGVGLCTVWPDRETPRFIFINE